MYYYGKCVAGDEQKAKAWLRKSAEQGYYCAQESFANLFRNDDDRVIRYEAAKWLDRCYSSETLSETLDVRLMGERMLKKIKAL